MNEVILSIYVILMGSTFIIGIIWMLVAESKTETKMGEVSLIIFGVLLAGLIISLKLNPPQTEKKTTERSIISLYNESEVNGKFFRLGSGWIEETEYYFMFTQNADKSYSRIKIKVNSTKIFQENNVQPKIIQYSTITYRRPYRLLGIPMQREVLNTDVTYSLIVPVGTIVEQFKVR